MNSIWIRNDYVRRETKLKLYKTLVKPVLLYNSSTWGYIAKSRITTRFISQKTTTKSVKRQVPRPNEEQRGV